MRQAYDGSYYPSIPTLDIRLYSSTSDEFGGPFSAIIDTGSDATLIPLDLLLDIGAEETAPGWMIGITGNRQPVSLYFVDVYIGEMAFPGIRVIADLNAEEVILGRDVLNKLPLLLDGLEQQTILLDDAMLKRVRAM
jgi:hypothetical protein